ncbi:MAG: L-threonylcarbamoyladenylate synthase [Flavobacteriales bacterium]
MSVIGTDIHYAAELLRQGDLVAIPTETVYGLAANAFNPEAVIKIFQAKQRPAFDPLIVHIHDRSQVASIASELPPGVSKLMDAFWPGPLTLVLPKTDQVPDIVTSGLNTVGVRMPAHPMALELLRSLPFPLAAPSANPFGYVSPTTAQHVADQLGEQVPYILDGGPCAVGVESTILGWEQFNNSIDGQWVLYRPGGIGIEELEAVIGSISTAKRTVIPAAPGMLESHYAPRKPVYLGDVRDLLITHQGQRVAVISLSEEYPAWRCERLSPVDDLNEAARNLFGVLRDLDRSDADVILAEVFPELGLGRAINDRLRRAAAK